MNDLVLSREYEGDPLQTTEGVLFGQWRVKVRVNDRIMVGRVPSETAALPDEDLLDWARYAFAGLTGGTLTATEDGSLCIVATPHTPPNGPAR